MKQLIFENFYKRSSNAFPNSKKFETWRKLLFEILLLANEIYFRVSDKRAISSLLRQKFYINCRVWKTRKVSPYCSPHIVWYLVYTHSFALKLFAKQMQFPYEKFTHFLNKFLLKLYFHVGYTKPCSHPLPSNPTHLQPTTIFFHMF